jgi:hypothetical protein
MRRGFPSASSEGFARIDDGLGNHLTRDPSSASTDHFIAPHLHSLRCHHKASRITAAVGLEGGLSAAAAS